MKVIATSKYKEKGLKDKELGRIPEEGEEFDVSAERFEILNGYNQYNEVFVTLVGEEAPAEATLEVEEEPKKSNTKKKKSK